MGQFLLRVHVDTTSPLITGIGRILCLKHPEHLACQDATVLLKTTTTGRLRQGCTRVTPRPYVELRPIRGGCDKVDMAAMTNPEYLGDLVHHTPAEEGTVQYMYNT